MLVNQATAGGGGRGMRLANEPGEFVKLLQVSYLFLESLVVTHHVYPATSKSLILPFLVDQAAHNLHNCDYVSELES